MEYYAEAKEKKQKNNNNSFPFTALSLRFDTVPIITITTTFRKCTLIF
jgi:hypothetical protein